MDGLRFYHTDHLGSSDVITNAAGTVVEHTEHLPYGTISRHDGPANVPYKFTGQLQDTTNSLILFPARAYDPQLGRFTQPDTFVQDHADPQLLNRYSYVRNNPVNLIDPSGNFIFALIAAIFAIATAVSVVASVTSSIASATGHERAAQFAARVGVAAGWVSFGVASVANLVTGGELTSAVVLSSLTLTLAYTAQGVAKDVGEAHLPVGLAVSRQFTNTTLQSIPGVSQALGLYTAITGTNPIIGAALSPLDRALVGGLSLIGLRHATTRVFSKQLVEETEQSSGRLLRAFRFFGKKEAQDIERNGGRIPNIDELGRPKEVHLTTDEFKSASQAERALQIGQFDPRGPRPTPKFGAEVDLEGVTLNRANHIENGSTIEITTYGSPKVKRLFKLDE